MMQIISLGAGVQSSTMALMAAQGELPMPDCAIFADTGAEPDSVYTWLAWLTKELPFPVYRVGKGNLTADSLEVRTSAKSGNDYLRTLIPFFTLGTDGKKGMLMRKCTRDYKVDVITRKVKALLEIPHGRLPTDTLCQQWIGISLDEVIRMKPSQLPYSENIFPLIDKRMTRRDCLVWMQNHYLLTPPRSACTYCPYHSDREWLRLRDDEPVEFERAIEFEQNIHTLWRQQTVLKDQPFLHASRVPLAEVQFDSSTDTQIDMFNNECEGMCGV